MSKTKSPFVFHILPPKGIIPSSEKNCAFLEQDNWDDWGKYSTQFFLTIVDDEGQYHQIGVLKIGQIGLKAGTSVLPGQRKPDIPKSFERVGKDFFSLGQEAEYYENLNKLSDPLRKLILASLRDVAFDKKIWNETKKEVVTGESLLRQVSAETVEGQYRRMALGGARLTPYKFKWQKPIGSGAGSPFEMEFRVNHESIPPTNVHVLIGRNGVGKTQLLIEVVNSLIKPNDASNVPLHGKLKVDKGSFANLVIVSFSAFDCFKFPYKAPIKIGELNYSYIGFRQNFERDSSLKIESKDLASEFVESLAVCCIGARRQRWVNALQILETDPMFQAASLSSLIELDLNIEENKVKVTEVFKNLSSGHKAILLAITRLIETVVEKTLVLMDEPEAHLHPPLLSAFIRALSDLLVDRNGVAIIATHSPVVLQEVPASCVWMLSRYSDQVKAERPSIETFGENLGVLTREVFQLELTQAGYLSFLRKAVDEYPSYETALLFFEGELGSEAKAVLRALFNEKNGSLNA